MCVCFVGGGVTCFPCSKSPRASGAMHPPPAFACRCGPSAPDGCIRARSPHPVCYSRARTHQAAVVALSAVTRRLNLVSHNMCLGDVPLARVPACADIEVHRLEGSGRLYVFSAHRLFPTAALPGPMPYARRCVPRGVGRVPPVCPAVIFPRGTPCGRVAVWQAPTARVWGCLGWRAAGHTLPAALVPSGTQGRPFPDIYTRTRAPVGNNAAVCTCAPLFFRHPGLRLPPPPPLPACR